MVFFFFISSGGGNRTLRIERLYFFKMRFYTKNCFFLFGYSLTLVPGIDLGQAVYISSQVGRA